MAMACRSYIRNLYTALKYSSFCHAKHLSSLTMADSSTSSSLLGPPEIQQQTDNNLVNPPMGPTRKSSPNFVSTGNPCLDFFFHVVPNTQAGTLTSRLQIAWKHDPLKALKLVCNLRGVRGTGKSDKEGGINAALWLHENHPKTLACNVDSFAGFGYFKDLLEILFRIVEGPYVRNLWMEDKIDPWGNLISDESNENGSNEIDNVKRVVDRYDNDPDFKFLHDRVADYFVQCLRSDMKVLDSGGDSSKISQAAKWWPSLHSSYHRFTLLCETIAKKVFPRDEYPEYEGVEETHYAYYVSDRLRKQVLVPLRKALDLPEVYMEANNWGSIPYHRVASDEMLLYMDKFLEHDGERFMEYIKNVKIGKAEIAASTFLLHKIIAYLDNVKDWCSGIEKSVDDGGQVETLECKLRVGNLQLKRMVRDMEEKGELNNCLAICHYSKGMYMDIMDVSAALGVLVSELSSKPWKGRVITFNENAVLQKVRGRSLVEKTKFDQILKRHGKPNLQKVFNALLQMAVDGKLEPDQMIKRVFVFSDTEFDEASKDPWETDYEAIVRKFKEKGYGECVPEIVFWKLGKSEATPVQANQPGVALVSGFSSNLMTLFLELSEIKDPEAVMEVAISGQEYQKLQVFD
ncbi:hypothetical protein CASFOL_030642 [Castilleja foliolosa]|uniref:Uncharacterized protein n=1 Tax=Castilleja foliolosa TaxID=1961234 RepID=A0ABD3C6Q3_9LAMI